MTSLFLMVVPSQPVASRDAEAKLQTLYRGVREVENRDCFVHSQGNSLLTSFWIYVCCIKANHRRQRKKKRIKLKDLEERR